MTDFLQNGVLTADGKKVIDAMNAHVAENMKPGKTPNDYNAMSGVMKHYGVHVVMTKIMTPEQWIAEYTTPAESVMETIRIAEQRETVAEQTAANTDATNKLTEELDKLKLMFAEQAKELEALKGNKKQKPATEDKSESEA